jgi:hypothetical protein
MVFKITFNNISAISWWSVLLVEETWVPGENPRAEILLKVILNTITLTLPRLSWLKRMLRDQSDQNLWQFSNIFIFFPSLFLLAGHQLLWVKIANNYLKSNSCANLNYVSPHFGGETYCFCPVRLSVSATPLKLLNRISWNLCLQITPTKFRRSKFPGNMHNYIWCPYYLPSFMKFCSVVYTL